MAEKVLPPEAETLPLLTAQDFHVAVEHRALGAHLNQITAYEVNAVLEEFIGIDKSERHLGPTDAHRAQYYARKPEELLEATSTVRSLLTKHALALAIDPTQLRSGDEMLRLAREHYVQLQKLERAATNAQEDTLKKLLDAGQYSEAYAMLVNLLEEFDQKPFPEFMKRGFFEEATALIRCMSSDEPALGVGHTLVSARSLEELVRASNLPSYELTGEAKETGEWGLALINGVGGVPSSLNADGTVQFGFDREGLSMQNFVHRVTLDGRRVEKIKGTDVFGALDVENVKKQWNAFLSTLKTQGYHRAFSHKTSMFMLSDIIQDKTLGFPLGHKGHFHSDFEKMWGITRDTLGVFVEELFLDEEPMSTIYADGTEPVFIFAPTASEKMMSTNRDRVYINRFLVIVNGISLSDPDLLHIWVPTSTFRKNLLFWINTWPIEQRTATFGEKNIEEFFVC